jgi:hypothetical protein
MCDRSARLDACSRRPADDQAALWDGTARGSIHCIATDELCCALKDKTIGNRIDDTTGGNSGVEPRLGVMYTEMVVRRGYSLLRYVDLVSSNAWSSRARNKSCSPPSRHSRGRIESSAPEPQEQGIRAFDSRESPISILQGNRPKHPETRQNPAPQFAQMSPPITAFCGSSRSITSTGVMARMPFLSKSWSRPVSHSASVETGVCFGSAVPRMIPAVVGMVVRSDSAASNSSSGTAASFSHSWAWAFEIPAPLSCSDFVG